jgi:hypothetical protein
LGMYYNGIIEYSQYSDPRSIRGLSTGISSNGKTLSMLERKRGSKPLIS